MLDSVILKIKDFKFNKDVQFTQDELDYIIGILKEKKIAEKQIVPGDVVTDNGYHGRVVVTAVRNGWFEGYYVEDGVTVKGLELAKFKKVSESVGNWIPTRTGAVFIKKEGDEGGVQQ